MRQLRVHDRDRDGLLQAVRVRQFAIGSESEGCVADDRTGALYISEEDVGLWRYRAGPRAGSTRTIVDRVRPHGRLARDVEGPTLVHRGSEGYLIASAQNVAHPWRSYFAVYDRSTNAYRHAFRIGPGARADGCQRTDGIAAYAGSLGPGFPQGVFVCQDGANTAPGRHGNQDFKLARLDDAVDLG